MWRSQRVSRRALTVLVVAALGSALIGGSAGCGDGDEPAVDRQVGKQEGSAAAPAPGFAPGMREQSQLQGPSSQGEQTERREVVTGNVDITADGPVAAAGVVTDRVFAAQGRIDKRTERPGTGEESPRAELTVRVPADRTDAFLEGMGDIGTVTEVGTNRRDVTMRWEDLDAKISALRASVDRLRALLVEAANTADLIDAEEALADRQGDLDSLTAQKRRLDDQITMSTLTVTITTDAETTPEKGPNNFWDGIVSGWNSLVDWLQDAVVFVGKALPWLGFLAVLGAVLGAIVGAVRRLRGSAKADTGEPARRSAAGLAASSGEVTGESTTEQGDSGVHRAGDDHTEQS